MVGNILICVELRGYLEAMDHFVEMYGLQSDCCRSSELFNKFSLCVGFWKNRGHCRYKLDTSFQLFRSVVPFV
jgi:hypothetical protein